MNETARPHNERANDRGLLCFIAMRAGQFWDFIDKRQIDAQIYSGIILGLSIKITVWAMHFAIHSDRPGTDIAAILAAVLVPWSGLQTMALKFHLDARK